MKHLIIAASAMVAFGSFASLSPAQAKGCGGYVNVAVWGCAPWDNNGPKAGVTPGYKVPAPVAVRTPPPTVAPSLAGGRLITDNGGGLISPGNRNGVISNDGGSFIGHNGSSFVGNNGSAMRR